MKRPNPLQLPTPMDTTSCAWCGEDTPKTVPLGPVYCSAPCWYAAGQAPLPHARDGARCQVMWEGIQCREPEGHIGGHVHSIPLVALGPRTVLREPPRRPECRRGHRARLLAITRRLQRRLKAGA